MKKREKISGSTWSAIQKDCENADCGKCERCIDEMDDPIGCLSKEEICFSTSILIIIFIILIIIIL